MHLYLAGICSLLISLEIVSVANGAATPDECNDTGGENTGMCCKHKREPESKEKQEEYENNMKNCFSKYFGDIQDPPPEDVKISLMECVGECFFNASGLLTPDLKLSQEKLNAKDDIVDPDPKWKAIDEAAVKSCFDKSVAEGNGSAKCKSGSFQFLRCVLRERFLNCPKDVWTDGDECNNYRKVVEKCPNVIPGVA
uniref:Odorant-binding protein 28 n=1 Tax=Halyomorpha halys TaxID=286706 RepID=A0A1N7TMV5_HALHY|nr:odorant-binding protein 28 [Halyomorpha halys]